MPVDHRFLSTESPLSHSRFPAPALLLVESFHQFLQLPLIPKEPLISAALQSAIQERAGPPLTLQQPEYLDVSRAAFDIDIWHIIPPQLLSSSPMYVLVFLQHELTLITSQLRSYWRGVYDQLTSVELPRKANYSAWTSLSSLIMQNQVVGSRLPIR